MAAFDGDGITPPPHHSNLKRYGFGLFVPTEPQSLARRVPAAAG
jgi:hypothetical protein